MGGLGRSRTAHFGLRDNSFWGRCQLELPSWSRWPWEFKVVAKRTWDKGILGFRGLERDKEEKIGTFLSELVTGVESLCLSVPTSMKYVLDYFSLLNFHFLREAMSDMWVLRLKRPGFNSQTANIVTASNSTGPPFPHLHNGNDKTHFPRLLGRWDEVMSGKEDLLDQ